MTPPDNSEEKPPAASAHKFPPGLDFLDSFQKAQQTEDREMKCAILATLLQNIRDFQDRLRQHGLDPDRLIAWLEPAVSNLAAANKRIAAAQEQLLHSIADKADAEWAVVDAIEEAIKVAAQERPFDPQVEEWKEMLEELREDYPKLD